MLSEDKDQPVREKETEQEQIFTGRKCMQKLISTTCHNTNEAPVSNDSVENDHVYAKRLCPKILDEKFEWNMMHKPNGILKPQNHEIGKYRL